MQTTMWFLVFGFCCFKFGEAWGKHQAQVLYNLAKNAYDIALAQSKEALAMQDEYRERLLESRN